MATKITLSTGNRYLDEDVRRLYALATQAQADIASLKAPLKTPVVPAPNVDPLPSIGPSATVNPVEASSQVGVSSSYAPGDHAHEGVHSIAATGQPEILGDATLSAGAGITLTQTASDIEIAASLTRYTGTVVLASPSATFTVTHSLAVATPFLVYVGIYSSAGVQVSTAGATFVFTTNGLTITFLTPLAADTYSVLVLA